MTSRGERSLRDESAVVLAASGGAAEGHKGRRGRRHGYGEKSAPSAGEERLAKLVRERGGYNIVEVGYQGFGQPSVPESVERAIVQGARRVIVVPIGFADANLSEMVVTLRQQHPDVEILYVDQPLDPVRYADSIITRIRDHDMAYMAGQAEASLVHLSALQQGETGMIYDFEAGHTLVSRLSALGFTPDVRVTMLQNFGHGPVIVSVRDTRIALGRGEAGRIRVRRSNSEE